MDRLEINVALASFVVFTKTFLLLGVFAVVYLSVNGLGIAIYRILYIKQDHLVKYRIGEYRLFIILQGGSFVIAILLSAMFMYETVSNRITMNLCTGKSEFAQQVLLDYFRSQGAEFDSTKTFQITSAAICIGMGLMEIGCYVVFFHHCYKNDNGNIRLYLPPEVTRHRNTGNAITFIGQLYSFIAEFTFMTGTVIVIVVSDNEIRGIGSAIKLMEFGILSAVEVLTSAALRKSIRGNIT